MSVNGVTKILSDYKPIAASSEFLFSQSTQLMNVVPSFFLNPLVSSTVGIFGRSLKAFGSTSTQSSSSATQSPGVFFGCLESSSTSVSDSPVTPFPVTPVIDHDDPSYDVNERFSLEVDQTSLSLLRSDLQIEFELMILTHNITNTVSNMIPLANDLNELWTTGNLADIRLISAGGRDEFKAHKQILMRKITIFIFKSLLSYYCCAPE